MMQHFTVVRGRLLTGHLFLAALCLALAGVSGYFLLAFPPGVFAAAGLAVLAAVALLLPAVVYRVYLLWTARYAITPAGALHIRFGSRKEVIPIEEIEEIRSGGKISDAVRKAGRGWLESWQGWAVAEGEQAADWIATDRGPSLLLLVSKRRLWAISPSDPAGFARSITDLSARGSLEKIEAESAKSPPFILDIFQTRPALASLAGGWFLIIALGVFLLALLPTFPLSQPFRFTPSGLASSLGDPARLLILPFMGGAVWLLNAILGWRAWRINEPLAAYALWIGACAVAGGLWVATLLLLRAG
jgi:hypothetical protein